MSGREVSSRGQIEAMGKPPTGTSEAASAEERGAARLRARLREMLEERRRVVRLGEQQIEVVEVTAVEDVLGADSEADVQPGERTGDETGDQTSG